MRICFLFNHDQIHQVAHSLPVALELAAAAPWLDLELASTNQRVDAEIARLTVEALPANVRRTRLGLTTRTSRLLAQVLGKLIPANKLLIYRDNLEFFRSFDALVVAEKTSLILKSRYKLDRLRIIHTRHGAGDRAIGFDRASAGFDQVLVSGPKIRDRLIAEARVPAERIAIVGYPKFDAFVRTPPTRLFANDRPTVLYNPHGSPALSSWFRMGRAVLEHFLADQRYNLIFAPHVMLFERPWSISIDPPGCTRPGRIDRRFLEAPNILVDLGSPAFTDMTYTNAADIYLGDVSSQVYEFLRHPRPCLFLDAHGTDWRGNPDYAHWTAGPVITDVGSLPAALEAAEQSHASRYRAVQERLFAYSFDLDERRSSTRAAAAILDAMRDPQLASGNVGGGGGEGGGA